jgi:phosphatidate cytidylyltransferase
MLKQRVITAIVLLAILLPALFWRTPEPFLAITLVLVAAGGWEWGRLIGFTQGTNIALGGVTAALCAATWALGGPAHPQVVLWLVVGAAWVLAGAALVLGGVDGWPRIPRGIRLVGGILALVLAWLAMAQARVIGVNFLLSILVLVWVADVFAYFAGRAFGGRFTRRKLAPVISPKKSWEGVWGGMAGVVVLAIAWTLADRAAQADVPSLYSLLASLNWLVVVLAALFLGAMSVVGDLTESLVKRSAGIKDSSQLLPGHGGVLDRVDALLPTLPLAMMLATLAMLAQR